MIWFALSLLASEGIEPEAVARAKSAETAAFAAVDREQWCSALDLFLEANAVVANADLVFNAAHAAENAGDRARAVQLYTELLGHAPTAERKSASKKKIKALTALVEKDGAGPSCPPPVVAAPVTPVVTSAPPPSAPSSEPEPSTPPPSAPPASAASTPIPSESFVVEELAPEHVVEPPRVESGIDLRWPWVTAGIGGGVAVLGIAGLAVGGYQYLAYATAKDDLAEVEDRSSVAFAEASFRREAYAETWNGWGSNLAVAGGIALGVGVAAAVVGGVAVVLDLE